MNESDPARRPLLFPDPVVEFYLERVDRAAIREQLKKTPAERLQWLEDQTTAHSQTGQARVREEPSKAAMNAISPENKFAGFSHSYTPDLDPASRPLLFPDPVVEAYLKDVDRGLIRENLKLTVAARLDNFEDFMRGVYQLRGLFYKGDMPLWEEHSVSNAGTTSKN
jgi:hypothetical protein